MHRAGSSLADVARARAWFTDGDAIEPIRATHPVLFDDPGPALSVIGVPNLPNGVKVMLELEAVIGSGARLQRYMPQEGQGWSHAVRNGDEIWVSGLTWSPLATSWPVMFMGGRYLNRSWTLWHVARRLRPASPLTAPATKVRRSCSSVKPWSARPIWSHESRLAGPTRRSTTTVVPFALAPTSWAAQTNS